MSTELHRITIAGNLAGQYRTNVLHWQIDGPSADLPYANTNLLLTWFNTNIIPLWLACLPEEYYLDNLTSRRIGPTPGQYSEIDYAPMLTPGTRSGSATSEQLCPCVTLIPPMDVKSGGKVFMPAVNQTDCNTNAFTGSYITVIQTLFNAMIAGGSVAGGTAKLVIYSRKLNTQNDVASFHLSPVLGYQRRRAHPVGS